MEWVIPDLKEKPILPLCPWALAAAGAATGPDCLEQHSGSCQMLASSAKAPPAPPEPHAHGICCGKAGRSTGEMGLIQSCVPAPLSPPWCQPERQNWSCQAELGFFRDMISLRLTEISASKRQQLPYHSRKSKPATPGPHYFQYLWKRWWCFTPLS